MVMPIWDHNPFKWPTPPYVMWLLIAINFGIFFLQVSGGFAEMIAIDQFAGLIPSAFAGHHTGGLPPPFTLITYQFLHANLAHVSGNMIFLFVFGDDIEEVLGHWKFLVFYLLSGAAAGLVFALSAPGTQMPLIGASGAVAGVIAAYLLFRPCAKVSCLLGLIPLRLRAYWLICGWAIWQVVGAGHRVQDHVAYWAHIGGLIAGAALFVAMRPSGIKLLDCSHSEPVLVAGKFRPPA
jgi:membrane associated rhomboid family serine protease